ncbi:MAG: nucleotide exchange factor GrpE [Bacilli bacterium]|nr:nucleotide exchange factor GrpE [Bacilli bacterium]
MPNEDVKIEVGDLELDEVKDSKKKEKKNKKESINKDEYNKVIDAYTKLEDQYAKALSTAAHYKNLQERYQKDYETMMKYRSQALMENLLSSLDSFQIALKFDAPTPEAQNYKIGFEFIYKMMLEALGNEGMVVVTPKIGEEFDSTKHQVMEAVECEEEKDVNKICEVMLNGYMIKDRVIRPASVKIYRLKEKEVVAETTAENVN